MTWQASGFTGSDFASIDAVAVAGDVLFGVASPPDEDGATAALWSSDGGASWTVGGQLETPPGTGPVIVGAVATYGTEYSVLGSRFLGRGGRIRAWHGP